jgi:ring-1,2-phenylacetyl-CoA epoxidase subunit PaaE
MTQQLLSIFQSTLQSIVTSLASSLGLVTIVFIIFWIILAGVLANRRIQTVKRAGFNQIRDEIFNTVLVTIASTMFTVIIFWFRDSGWTKFYIDTGRYGLWYEVCAIIVVLLISDAWFYWTHRWLHHPKIYKYIHAVHHKSLDTTPYTTFSFHPIEGVLNTVWILPLVMIMPVSLFALGIVQVLGMFNNIKSHLGYELYPKFFSQIFPLNMLVTSTNHNLHHTRYNGNYALMIRFWDIVCGTEIQETEQVIADMYDRKNTVILENTVYQKLIISKLVKETHDTISVYFEPTNPDFYKYRAGQYINVRVTLEGKKYDRTFSLSSSPLDRFLRITVKLNGKVSHYFYNKAKVGDSIQALLPVGDFVLEPANEYLFIAGGSGITPLYSMIRTLLVEQPTSKLTLLYANSSLETTIFAQELEVLAKKYPQLTIKHFLSGQARLSEADIAQVVGNKQDIQAYICGPIALKEVCRTYLKNNGVTVKQIHTEDYADGFVPWFGLTSSIKSKPVEVH